MPTLTTNQINALQTKITNGDIAGFYTDLAGYGDGYGDLALTVTNNDGWEAKLSNAFAASGAADNSINLAYGGTAWTNLNADIADRYLQAYRDNSNSTPAWDDVRELHNEAYEFAGLDADDWLPNRILNNASDPAAEWDDFLVSQGASDLWEDALDIAIAGAGLVFPPYFTTEAVSDPEFVAQIDYARHFFDALARQSDGDRTAMASEMLGVAIDDLVDLLNALPNGVNGLLDDITNALDDPETVLEKVLPSWVSDILGLFDDAKTKASPLIIDLDGDGVEATTFNAATTATFFDLDSNGFAQQTAWVGAHDGLLVRDVNENGTIDNGSELFGSPTIDGFALLQQLDSNGDLVIDQYDDAWSELLIWKDANGDAISQESELEGLGYHLITSINLAGVASSGSTVNGNPISHTSTVTKNGSSAAIADVWFVHDHMNTTYVGNVDLDPRVLFLPTLRGFGKVADLHIAMSQDEDLLELVEDLATGFSLESFADGAALDAAVEDILLTWAGVDAVSPTSRGDYIDARQLEFLEQYIGEEWLQRHWLPDPTPIPAAELEHAFQTILHTLKAHLLVQIGGEALFSNAVTYDVWAGEIDGDTDLDQTAIDGLVDYATAPGVDEQAFWTSVGAFLLHAQEGGSLSGTEEGWLDQAMDDSGLTVFSWADVEDSFAPAALITNTINATGSSQTLNGTSANDSIIATGGNNELYGNAGNDQLYGASGNDLLSGGTGGNLAVGGAGNDTYVYTSGHDIYQEASGTDKIVLPVTIAPADLAFTRVSNNGLYIDISDGEGSILIDAFFETGGAYVIETIDFTTADPDMTIQTHLSSLLLEYAGTSGNDTLTGTAIGGTDLQDYLLGFGGDDVLDGNGANDTLDGGLGNDTLYGDGGDDTYVFSPGFDIINESGGTDTILIPVGYDASDLTFFRSSAAANSLTLTVTGLGQIQNAYQFQHSSYAFEYIAFASGGSPIAMSTYSVETIGTSANNTIYGITDGASTNDIMNGMGGNDTLYGDAGNDIYIFSEGDDIAVEASGTDTLKFRADYLLEDVVLYRMNASSNGQPTNDLMIEDAFGNSIRFNDHFNHSAASAMATALEQLVFSDDSTVSVYSLEIETRGDNNDNQINEVLYGDASSADTIYAYAGNDTVNGGAGNDVIYAGDDVDTVNGQDGDDLIYGGNGNDILFGGWSDNGVDTIYGEAGNDSLYGYGGNDTLQGGSGSDSIDGGGDTDTVSYSLDTAGVTVNLSTGSATDGNSDTDTLSNIEGIQGSEYADTLTGNSGSNTIKGGAGNDTISGNDGADTLYGGAGTDSLTGGNGADTFVFEIASAFSNQDTVADFSAGSGDKIDLHDVIDIEFDPLTEAISQFVDFTNSGGNSIMSVDRDGTGTTYSFANVATITGVTNLDETTLYNNGNLLAA